MKQNPKLCQHIWGFGCTYETYGMAHPKRIIVLFCSKCADLKLKEAKQ